MELKISFVAILVCVCQLSFSQANNSQKNVLDNISKQQEFRNSINNLSNNNSKHNNDIDLNLTVYSDEEWAKIKSQIKNNKKRVIKTNEVFISKVIDTVYIEIPPDCEPQLSSW